MHCTGKRKLESPHVIRNGLPQLAKTVSRALFTDFSIQIGESRTTELSSSIASCLQLTKKELQFSKLVLPSATHSADALRLGLYNPIENRWCLRAALGDIAVDILRLAENAKFDRAACP